MTNVEAVFLDVGGVFSLPAVADAVRYLAEHGAEGTPETVERCHYHGIAAYDVAEGGEPERSVAYLTGFLGGAGLGADHVPGFAAAIRVRGWQPAIRASLEALPRLA